MTALLFFFNTKILEKKKKILTFASSKQLNKMTTLVLYIIISLVNVFLHITRSIFVIKSGKLIASLMNCICYTFSAVVIKFIAETDLCTAIIVQASTNFIGCYLAMLTCEKVLKKQQEA